MDYDYEPSDAIDMEDSGDEAQQRARTCRCGVMAMGTNGVEYEEHCALHMRLAHEELTRQEKLEGLADRGTDTWEEYRGER